MQHGDVSSKAEPKDVGPKSVTDRERGCVGILMDAHLDQFDAVRNPKRSFLDTLDDKLSQKLSPRHRTVRGNIVAADTLVNALIRHAKIPRRLFIYPEGKTGVVARLNSLKEYVKGSQNPCVNSVFELLSNVDRYDLKAWFSPMYHCTLHGGIEIAHRIRSHFASKPYPITTLFHGLAGPRLFYNVYLQVLLQPTLECDSIICTSRASRESVRKILEHMAESLHVQYGFNSRYRGRFDIIPLCVDTDRLCPKDKGKVRKQLKLPQESFTILYLGRISPLKADLHPFLRVFQWIVRRNPHKTPRWIIAGTEEPGYSRLILDQARELGLTDYVTCFLNVSDETKSLLLSAADVFVSPVDTLDESFGLSPVEAMACGVPQVVPDWDGYRDTVSHGQTGFLVPTYWADCCLDLSNTGVIADGAFDRVCIGQSVAIDARQQFEQIQLLIDNNDLRHLMAQRSRERALSLYSGHSISEQYEQLWDSLADIASGLQWAKSQGNFDRALYYRFFQHYASAILDDHTTLQITSLVNEAMDLSGFFPSYSLPGSEFSTLELSILRQILSKFSPCTESERVRGKKVGELVRSLCEEDGLDHLDSHYLRRHIMWLVKHAYLEPILGP